MELIKQISDEKIRTIAVDFDGTLCQRKSFPEIGEPKTELILWLKQKREEGARVILWTCRENENLENAVIWCREQGLEFDAINENLKDCNIKTRKVIADIYIDDRACLPVW